MSDYFSRALALQDEPEGEMLPVQDPIPRPAPVVRPGEEMPRRSFSPRQPLRAPRQTAPVQEQAQPVQPQPQAEAPSRERSSAPTDYFSRALRNDENKPAEAPQETAQPDGRSWGRRAVDYVKGREDPQYKGTKTFTMDDADAGGDRNMNFRAGRVVAGSDEAYADIIKQSLGPRFKRIEKDSQGSMIVVFDGDDGPETKRYVNEPGLSAYDVERGAAQALPYIASATGVGKLMKGAGPVLRALGQGTAAGATSVGTDIAATPLGSEQGVDPGRAAVVGAFGAGGELAAPAIAAAWRNIVTVPGLYNKAAGQLTEKGVTAARQAGLDPADLTAEMAQSFAQTYARTGSESAAGQTTTIGQFKIPVTQGQRSKDPSALLNEKGMRYGVYGEGAKETMQSFDRRQAGAIREAAVGGLEADGKATGIAPMLAPGRPVGPSTPRPGEIGEGIRSGLKGAKQAADDLEDMAWGNVGPLVPKAEAFDTMPDIIASKLGPYRVDDKVTPKAFAMAEDIDGFIAGKTPAAGPKVIKQAPVRTVDDMRRRLLAQYKGASDDADRAASKAIYDGFNDWIDDAANKSLLSGDAQAAANLRLARDTTKELKMIFGEKGPDGKSSPGRRILQEVLDKADTPEAIVAKLFGNQGFDGAPKQGSMEALQLIKRGLDRYAEKDLAQATWNDIRLGLWSRMIQTKPGEIHTPTMLAKNIDSAMRSQQSIMKFLYSPEELRTIRNFSRAMKEIAYKDPNPSGSGTAAAFYAGQFGQALFAMLGMQNGPLSKIAQALLTGTGVKKAAGSVAAQTATSQNVRTSRPMLAPYTAPAGAQLER